MIVSVIFVAYRTPLTMLRESIASIRAAATAAELNIEIVVSDNGGIQDYASELSGVRIVDNGGNVGFGHAVNNAVIAARGDRILLMNPDSTVDISFFTALLAAQMHALPHTVFGGLLLKNGRPQLHAYNLWWGSLHLLLKKRSWAAEIDAIADRGTPSHVNRLCGAGLYARHEDLVALGPFEDDFFLYGEDVDFSLRAKRSGHPLVLVPTAVIDHDAGTSSEGASAIVERARIDGHLRILAHHRPYFFALLGRAEVALAATVSFAITRSPSARAAAFARFREVRRWGFQRLAPRLDPQGAA